MSSITSASTLPMSVRNAIAMLTSELLLCPTFTKATIAVLARSLRSSWASTANSSRYHITLSLAANRMPPMPLLTACLAAGIKWDQWAIALTAGKKTSTVMEISRKGVSWTGPGIKSVYLSSNPLASPAAPVEMTVGDHKFSVTPPTPCVAERPESPASSVSSSSSSSSSFFDSDGGSSASSSASSQCHSRSSSICSTQSAPTNGVERLFSHRRAASTVLVDTSSAASQAYKYVGGETNVVGGGVMLGGASAPKTNVTVRPTVVTLQTSHPARKGRSRAASRATNWRSVRA